jgi:hypothetical protein
VWIRCRFHIAASAKPICRAIYLHCPSLSLSFSSTVRSCTHPNDDDLAAALSEKDVMLGIFNYIDRIVTQVRQPFHSSDVLSSESFIASRFYVSNGNRMPTTFFVGPVTYH